MEIILILVIVFSCLLLGWVYDLSKGLSIICVLLIILCSFGFYYINNMVLPISTNKKIIGIERELKIGTSIIKFDEPVEIYAISYKYPYFIMFKNNIDYEIKKRYSNQGSQDDKTIFFNIKEFHPQSGWFPIENKLTLEWNRINIFQSR